MESEQRAEQGAGKAGPAEIWGEGGDPPHSLHCFSEQHHCCGLLQQDLAELCTPIGIASVPTVTVRPFSVEVRRWGRLGGGGEGEVWFLRHCFPHS